MFKIATIVAIVVTLSACASTNTTPKTAKEYCTGQVQMAANRMALSDDNGPLSGRADLDDAKSQMYKECLFQVAAK